MKENRKWQLYIDETGQFDKDDTVATAGLLIDRKLANRDMSQMVAALQFEALGIHWPLHTWVVRKPVVLALAGHLAREQSYSFASTTDREDAGTRLLAAAFQFSEVELLLSLLDPLESGGPLLLTNRAEVRLTRTLHDCRQAADLLLAAEPARADRIIECLKKGTDPDYNDVRRSGRRLRKLDMDLFHRLEDQVQNIDATYQVIFESLHTQEKTGGTHLFVTSESSSRDFQPPRYQDRYLSHLHCLLHRTAYTLFRNGGDHEVEVLPLARLVGWKHSKRRLLDKSIVKSVIAAAVPSGLASIAFFAGPVRKWQQGLTLPQVLSDYAANRALGLNYKRDSLAQLENTLTTRIGPYFRSGRPTRPHCAATGCAHAYLTTGPVGRANGWDWQQTRHWARDQALEWTS